MADVASGLEVGAASPLDPFAAALEAKGIVDGGDSASSSVADGLTYGDQTPEPAADPVEDTSGDVTTEEGDPDPLHEDPDVAAYLEKFQGDPDKALKAAVEAQKKIGQQGNELGEERKARQEMAERLARLEGQIAATPAAQPSPVNKEELAEQYLEFGGLQLATWATNNAPHLVDNILEIWGADEPFLATRFDREYSDWKREQAAGSAIPAAPSKSEEYIANQVEAQRMTDSMAIVQKDFENFDKFAEHLNEALDKAPRLIQEGVLSDDDEVQQDALRVVFERADRLYEASLKGDAAEAEASRRTAAKQTARVIRGQAGTPAPPTGGKDAEDAEAASQKRLKAAILGASTTSVREGLTFGK